MSAPHPSAKQTGARNTPNRCGALAMPALPMVLGHPPRVISHTATDTQLLLSACPYAAHIFLS